MTESKPVSPNLIRVLLVDKLVLERAGLRLLISGEPDLCLAGECSELTEAEHLAQELKPDIIVLAHPNEPAIDEMHLIYSLVRTSEKSRLILLVRSSEPDFYIQAVQNGALGVVLKTQPPETLLMAIRKVHAGEAWLDRSTVALVLTFFSRNRPVNASLPIPAGFDQLTKREREIVHLIGQGLNTKKIAQQLYISESTVRHNLTSIYEKVDVSGRLELLIYAYYSGAHNPSVSS